MVTKILKNIKFEETCCKLEAENGLLRQSVKYSFALFALHIKSLLKPLIVKNSHILTGICFFFCKKCFGCNLKVFEYRFQTSVKRSEK